MTRSIFSAQYDRMCLFLINMRKEAGMSQEQLARRLGRPQSFVSKFESKQRRLDVIELLEVVHALRTDGLGFIAKLLEGWPENAAAASPAGLWKQAHPHPHAGSHDGEVGRDGEVTTARRPRRGRVRSGAGGAGGSDGRDGRKKKGGRR